MTSRIYHQTQNQIFIKNENKKKILGINIWNLQKQNTLFHLHIVYNFFKWLEAKI